MIKIHKNITLIHPAESVEIMNEHSQEDYVNIFNEKEIFISYDPLTFLNIIAAMCGCVSVVIKVDGISTQFDWLQTTCVSSYVKDKGIERLYGIAYGIDEIVWAKETLHLVSQQWIDILEYCKNQTILPFLKDIEDLNNLKNAENTIQKIFF
jgi:glycogen synthase